MKIYLAINAYGVRMASVNKEEIEEAIRIRNEGLKDAKGFINNEIWKYQEIELKEEIEIYAMIYADTPYGHSIGKASVNESDMDYNAKDYFVEKFKVKL